MQKAHVAFFEVLNNSFRRRVDDLDDTMVSFLSSTITSPHDMLGRVMLCLDSSGMQLGNSREQGAWLQHIQSVQQKVENIEEACLGQSPCKDTQVQT